MVQCGALRHSIIQGIGQRGPDEVGTDVASELRTWIGETVANVFETPAGLDDPLAHLLDQPMNQWRESAGRYRRSGRGFQLWIRNEPRAMDWLRGEAA